MSERYRGGKLDPSNLRFMATGKRANWLSIYRSNNGHINFGSHRIALIIVRYIFHTFIFLCIFSRLWSEVILTKIKKKEILTYLYMTVRIPIGAKQGATGQRFSLGIDFG